ncbi:MAG TPA: glycosyltransferase family 2 protein [Candidatus Moranbacteria bacterium]|nr:glycosyltransferase family 2 protein [Candidatus Moranbacteria bacterium]HRZ33875.1 glycosyltransferase family 2 protein [Candidatus Moranbacteria bacterium]
MELSIIVTNYGNPELLRLCLDSIKKCVTGVTYELIVAESETKENTEMMMREDFPDVKFFPDKKNIGFMACVKKGIEYSSGEYILILNGDIVVGSDAVQKMLDFLKSDSLIGMVGPKLLNFNGTLQISCSRFYKPITIIYRRSFLGRFSFAKKHLDWFQMKDYDHKSPKEVDWLMGSAIMISREAIEKVGLMDPRYFMYFEDVDWCRRFWENGYKVIYYPLALMHHYHGRSSAKGGIIKALLINKYAWIHIFSAIKYFKKFWGKPLPKHN